MRRRRRLGDFDVRATQQHTNRLPPGHRSASRTAKRTSATRSDVDWAVIPRHRRSVLKVADTSGVHQGDEVVDSDQVGLVRAEGAQPDCVCAALKGGRLFRGLVAGVVGLVRLGGDRNTFERGHQGVPCQWSWTCTRALTCADQIRWQWRVAPACRSKRSRDAVGGSVATQSESMTRATRPFAPGRSGRSQGHRPAKIVRPTGARSFRDHQPGPTMVARQPQRDQLQWQHVKSNGTGRRACSPTLVNGWGHRGINRGNRKASRRMRTNLSTASQ